MAKAPKASGVGVGVGADLAAEPGRRAGPEKKKVRGERKGKAGLLVHFHPVVLDILHQAAATARMPLSRWAVEVLEEQARARLLELAPKLLEQMDAALLEERGADDEDDKDE